MELNRIYTENCLDTMDRMPDFFVDLTVTSPPYDSLRVYQSYSFDFEKVAKELFRVTKQGGIVVWVVADATIAGSESGTSFRQALYFIECGFKLYDTMIYEQVGGKPQNPVVRYGHNFEYMFVFSKGVPAKTNIICSVGTGKKIFKKKRKRHAENEFTVGTYNEGTGPLSNIWSYATGNNNSSKDKIAFQHPAIFPERLASDHIHSWSNAGDLIYDPFTGSGTTCKMAMLMNRNFIGSEISPEYSALAEKRIALHASQMQIKYA